MEGRKVNIVQGIKELVQEVTASNNPDKETLPKITESLQQYSDKLSEFSGNGIERKLQSDIENSAVLLWNWAVVHIGGGDLKPEEGATVRQIACNLILTVTDSPDSDLTVTQRQIMMTIKTSRAWLDCGKPGVAELYLKLASETNPFASLIIIKCVHDLPPQKLEKAYCKINQQVTESSGDNHLLLDDKMEMEKEMFKVLSYKAESCAAQGKFDLSIDCVRKAKELLVNIPNESHFLSMMCYNFGVEHYESGHYQESVAWLRECYDIGKTTADSAKQARTLRLLANVYLEWDATTYSQQALNAITLANKELPHLAGLYMMVKILLQTDDQEGRITSAFEELVNYSTCTLDIGISIVKCATLNKRHEFALYAIDKLTIKHKNSPEIGQIQTLHIESLLNMGRTQDGKNLIELCITGDKTSQQTLNEDTKKQIHTILWQHAAKYYEVNDYDEALQWYNYSLSLFSGDDHDNLNVAKLHRNKASCFLRLESLDKALDSVLLAEKQDPACAYNQFIKFKVKVAMNQSNEAATAVHRMCVLCNCQESGLTHPQDTQLICLAAQLAFEKKNERAAMCALECLVSALPDGLQLLTALRCLVRLQLTFLVDNEAKSVEILKICSFVKIAYDKLGSLIQQNGIQKETLEKEAAWFMKIAWNLGIQSADSSQVIGDMFDYCYKASLSSLCCEDMTLLVRQRTCLLMAAAADLEYAKELEGNDKQLETKRDILHKVLLHVETCRFVCRKIVAETTTSVSCKADGKPKDTTLVLLLLYEFEARVNLGQHGLDDLLEKALQLPNSEPKTFETIAALSMNPGHENRGIAIRAVKVAIKKRLQLDGTDYAKCSKAFQSLIQLTLYKGHGDCAAKQESWPYFIEALSLIEDKAKNEYPEVETLWLMTKAWNCGIHLYSATKYDDAEKWCALSLRFLNRLATLKMNYQEKMTRVYSDILSKLDNTNDNKMPFQND